MEWTKASRGVVVKIVRVELGERSYDVVVGRGALSEIGSMLPNGARRAVVVTQEGIPANMLPSLGVIDTAVLTVGKGEENKNLDTIESLCTSFADHGLTRSDVVIGVGGGMVTDVAGFAAAVYHRGIAVVHVATSLLAMIDAAVGGKTGVNLSSGKNLVGAFWQPRGVVCDLRALDTLPVRERRCGEGEMAKYHFIAREDLAALPYEERIARSIAIKAGIVAEDEREGGRRALLNYGHTLGHALEIATNFDLAHGEAVAVGLLYAAELARVLGRIDEDRVNEHYRVLREVYDLRVPLPTGLSVESLISDMGRDKKALDGHTFVLDGSAGLEVVPGVGEADMRSAWLRLVARIS